MEFKPIYQKLQINVSECTLLLKDGEIIVLRYIPKDGTRNEKQEEIIINDKFWGKISKFALSLRED